MKEGWIILVGVFLIMLGIVAYVDSPNTGPPGPLMPQIAPREVAPSAQQPDEDRRQAENAGPATSAALPAETPGTSEANAAETAPAAGEVAPAFVGPLEPPVFDIVRIENDGSAVLTGKANPGARVTISMDSKPIGVTMADVRGEWSLIFSSPLEPGPHDMTVKATSPDGTQELHSPEIVSIGRAAGSEEDPLVIMSRRPSDVPPGPPAGAGADIVRPGEAQ